jgi:multidrug efflux pump subunit AcrB
VEVGEAALPAAIKGAKQIGFTIVSITVSLLAVFIPILLMGGIVGRLFREFAVTLSYAITVSALVSLSLTPMMCSRLLRHEPTHGRLYRISERMFERILHAYDRALQLTLRHQPITLAIFFLTLGLTVYLFKSIPFGLFPQQDTGSVSGFSDAPQDISFPAMKERQAALNAVVLQDPAVNHMVSFVGAMQGSTGNTGNMFLDLKPIAVRKINADQLINRLRPLLAKVEGIVLFLQSNQDVKVGGRSSRTQYQYTLEDGDLAELSKWAPKMLSAMKHLHELTDVASDQQTAGLELDLDVDRDTASRLGLSLQAIDDAFYDAFGQRQVATTFTELNQYHIVLEVKQKLQLNPDALKKVYVRSSTGQQIPMSAFSTFRTSSMPLSINHQGQFPAVTLSFNLAPHIALSQAVDAVHDMEVQLHLPAGLHGNFQGTAQAFQASVKSEPWLLGAAVVAVYLVLGILYESLIHPFTILSTLPSAALGALVALKFFHTEFSIIALIGVVLLIGIVKKNAILMIDFALEVQREKKITPLEAIHQACLLRFRPILMTTMAAFFGAVPLAVGTGTGSELRQPLGLTIMGGLLFSQLLTLFTTPVIYLYLDRLGRRIRRWLGRELPDEIEPLVVPAVIAK